MEIALAPLALLPDALLEVGAGQQEGNVELPALSSEVFVQFPDSLPQNLGHGGPALFRDNAAFGLYLPAVLELCLEDGPEPLLYPSRMQLISPVAEAEPVAYSPQHHFSAWRLVPDSAYCSGLDEEPVGHPGTSVVLDYYSRASCHAVAEGHLLREKVIVPDDGADQGGVQGAEGVVHAGAGGLSCVAMMPVRALEEVAGLQHFPAVPLLEGQTALAYHLSGTAGIGRAAAPAIRPLPHRRKGRCRRT